MLLKTLKVSLVAILLSTAGALDANSNERSAAIGNLPNGAAFAQEYGRTLPPIGWVQFCERFKRDCADSKLARIDRNARTFSVLIAASVACAACTSRSWRLEVNSGTSKLIPNEKKSLRSTPNGVSSRYP